MESFRTGLQVLFFLIWSVAGLLVIVVSVVVLSSGVLTNFSMATGSMMNGPTVVY